MAQQLRRHRVLGGNLVPFPVFLSGSSQTGNPMPSSGFFGTALMCTHTLTHTHTVKEIKS